MQILIIQTAFIGDVILATPVLEKISRFFPNADVDFLVRRGNENVLEGNPKLRSVLVWDKGKGKLKNLSRIISTVRKNKYDLVINLHRFFSSGLITSLSGAGQKIGFKKNPLSSLFDEVQVHQIGDGTHEVERNLGLISHLTDAEMEKPRIYLSDEAMEKVAPLKEKPYLTIAPASIWGTKQFPRGKWIEFIRKARFTGNIYLLGSPKDSELCGHIARRADNERVKNLCGELSMIEVGALMKDAQMNYTNDSAPMHLASAVNAPVCAVFCSTVPDFGFSPLSDKSFIVELEEDLYCRPCGLHGYRKCPEDHFLCAKNIEVEKLIEVMNYEL